MSKEEFPRLQARVPKELKNVMDEFLDVKDMTQAEFIENYMPAVLMAIDEDLYLRLHKKYYTDKRIKSTIENRAKG